MMIRSVDGYKVGHIKKGSLKWSGHLMRIEDKQWSMQTFKWTQPKKQKREICGDCAMLIVVCRKNKDYVEISNEKCPGWVYGRFWGWGNREMLYRIKTVKKKKTTK